MQRLQRRLRPRSPYHPPFEHLREYSRNSQADEQVILLGISERIAERRNDLVEDQ